MAETTIPVEDNEENSRLLETVKKAESYGCRTAEQQNLLNMVHTQNSGKTFPQYVAALSAAGGALAAGTILGWTAPAGNLLVKQEEYGFSISKEEWSWVGAAMTLGGACVCIPIGFLINILGRKLTMLLLVLPFTVGWCLLLFASNIGMMYAARFLLGVSGGAFCVCAPMYTGEIASKEIRGTLGSFFQLMLVIGILFIYVIGWPLNVFWMTLVCGIIPLIFGAVFVFMPESPTYLITKGKKESAIKSIQWLRGDDYDYSSELAELESEEAKTKEANVSFLAALGRPATLKALSISLGLMFFQQLSGINAVIFYSTDIFRDANTGIDESLSTIVVGIMQVIATFISTLVVDKLGRRILLLTSGSVMAICTVLMGVYFFMQSNDKESVADLGWLPVVCLCVFIVVFSLGYGPVPWLMMGELFASDIKGVAGSLAGTFNWFLAFVVTKTFTNLKDAIGSGQTFWLFSGITAIGVVFVFFVVPETKGKSLVEIQQHLGGQPKSTEKSAPASNGTKI